MEIYSIKKGKHYFSGDKLQAATFAYSILFLSLVFSFTSLWWAFIPGFCVSAFLWNLMNKDCRLDSRRVMFSKQCTYKLSENYDQVNKLFGFSEGFHHWNSARFGWRCVDGETIEILAYCYVNGERIIKPMMKCKADSWIFCNLQNKKDKYVFRTLDIKNNGFVVYINKSTKRSFYTLFKVFIYKLFPYFGGKIPAPQDMKIFMVKLKT